MPFLPATDFPVDVLPNGHVRALADVVWRGHHGDEVTVPAGFVSDWGTVPWPIRAVLPPDGPLCRAFLVHDVLCAALKDWHRATLAWDRQEATNEAAERAGRGLVTPQGTRPQAPPFDAVDTDAVLRLIMAELGDEVASQGRRRPVGTGAARWLYWAGVRCGALVDPARRAGFLRARSVLPFLGLLVPGLVAVAPAAVGAIVSRALLGLGDALAWPWQARARRERAGHQAAAQTEHVAGILARAAAQPPCSCTPTMPNPRCARPEHRVYAELTEPAAPVVGDLPPRARHTAWSHPDGTGGCTCGWAPDPADPRARAVQAFEHIQATRDDWKRAGL